jgi:hypothetical protein
MFVAPPHPASRRRLILDLGIFEKNGDVGFLCVSDYSCLTPYSILCRI